MKVLLNYEHLKTRLSCITRGLFLVVDTAWKLSKYGDFSGPYFPAFELNTERRSISPYSVQMQENMDQKKLRIRTLFTQWLCCSFTVHAGIYLWLAIFLVYIGRKHQNKISYWNCNKTNFYYNLRDSVKIIVICNF